MKILSMITGAIAAATVQNTLGLPVRETTTIGNVANSAITPSSIATQSLLTESLKETTPFLENLLSQRQDTGTQETTWAQDPENYFRGLFREYWLNSSPIQHRKAWVAKHNKTDLSILQAVGKGVDQQIAPSQEVKDLISKHYSLILRVEREESAKVMSEAHSVRQKFAPYIICENLETHDKITIRATYTDPKGHQRETTVTCDDTNFKVVKIPKEAQNLVVEQSIGGEPFHEISRHGGNDFRSSKSLRSTALTIRELSEEKRSNLDKLIESGDMHAVISYAHDMIKAFGKNDKTGAYQAALRAKFAAMQAVEDLDTAQKWFDITKAAKERAKADRARHRASEL